MKYFRFLATDKSLLLLLAIFIALTASIFVRKNEETDTVKPVVDGWLEYRSENRAKELSLIEGKKAPEVFLKNWTNSSPIDPRYIKGKVILLDFWSTWCRQCIDRFARINRFYTEYRDDGLIVISVCASSSEVDMRTIVFEHKIAYPVSLDVENKTMREYLVDGFPDYYFIDKRGILRIADADNDSLEEIIQYLIHEVI